MENAFIGAGLACLIGAIVGGGLKAFGVEVPILASRVRQILLATLGALLLAFGLGVIPHPKPSTPPTPGYIITGVASPESIGPGQGTQIIVTVLTDHSTAVSGVVIVSIHDSTGGRFLDTGDNNVRGMPDDHAQFRTLWAPSQGTAPLTRTIQHTLQAEITRDGVTIGLKQITVTVHP